MSADVQIDDPCPDCGQRTLTMGRTAKGKLIAHCSNCKGWYLKSNKSKEGKNDLPTTQDWRIIKEILRMLLGFGFGVSLLAFATLAYKEWKWDGTGCLVVGTVGVATVLITLISR